MSSGLMQTTEGTLMAVPENPEYLNIKTSRVEQERADKLDHNTVRKHRNGGRWIVRDE